MRTASLCPGELSWFRKHQCKLSKSGFDRGHGTSPSSNHLWHGVEVAAPSQPAYALSGVVATEQDARTEFLHPIWQ